MFLKVKRMQLVVLRYGLVGASVFKLIAVFDCGGSNDDGWVGW